MLMLAHCNGAASLALCEVSRLRLAIAIFYSVDGMYIHTMHMLQYPCAAVYVSIRMDHVHKVAVATCIHQHHRVLV